MTAIRKALIVGIDHYDELEPLRGAVDDAYQVKSVLERNADGTVNFTTPNLLTGTSASQSVPRRVLKDALVELFAYDAEIALFYFSGHGDIDSVGGAICASDTGEANDGISLQELVTIANESRAQNRIIILDSCHSGAAGDRAGARTGNVAEISEGVTILTASTKDQYAMEVGGSGVFTSLLVDALSGAAGNLVGAVTPGSVYAHIDQSLGPWKQRPVFKTNVTSFVALREVEAPIDLSDLHALPRLFPSLDFQIPLDPTYEPDRSMDPNRELPSPDPQHTQDFAQLQRLVKVNLVRPVGETHMFYAAINSKACELTVLGQHYWKLADEQLI